MGAVTCFERARDACMRGGRLAEEGDVVGALDAVTAAIEALNEATDRLEDGDGVDPGRADGHVLADAGPPVAVE